MKFRLSLLLLLVPGAGIMAQDTATARRISDEIMLRGTCYESLRGLCKGIGHRLSGSPAAGRAVQWGEKALKEAGADKVWLQPVDVPHWVRGKESLKIDFADGKGFGNVPVLSLGNTVGTDGKILASDVIMVRNFEEFNALRPEDVTGRTVFFNYRFRQDLVNTFQGYGDAGPYRWRSPSLASAKGAAAVIIRSVSTGADDAPHTGSIRYADTVKPIPAVAVGNTTADRLEQACSQNKKVRMQLSSECKMLGTVRSYNVIGELRGTEHPEEIALAGGHLDSWDVGDGAHDDGAGCVQSIEVIRTLKALNIRPKRTIRVVLFMNEENGLKGGLAYADSAKARNEKHIFAVESDAGGFSPRGFGMDMDAARKAKIKSWAPLFLRLGVYDFDQEGDGADIGPLAQQGCALAGLLPDPQRYFDVHHTRQDVFEAVNHRELKLGAAAMTLLMYLVSEYGL